MADEVEANGPSEGEDSPGLEHGTYEIIRERLANQARALGEQVVALNASRLEIFGSSEMAMIESERIRTENNCIPRDIAIIGNTLLFGYNVFIGLRTETKISDVFCLHQVEEAEDGLSFSTAMVADAHYLAAPQFERDFQEIYQYYSGAHLAQLMISEQKLLAAFKTGESVHDVKVFRWSIDNESNVQYIDNRGDRDYSFPPSHDFSWTPTSREDHVEGRHPHITILDEVFVETIDGDLTIKVEDNTEDGRGIYREPVEDETQSLEDSDISYAKVGNLILLKIRPYRENAHRYFVFNTRNDQVNRIDAIGHACIELPDDHGLIFPGGYYLTTGETKSFDGDVEGMQFQRVIRSPNGEDVLYVFHERNSGNSILLSYNRIRKELQNPIHCHGFSFFDDGKLVIFRAVSEEPTRVHTMQIWQTPFTSDDHASQTPSTGSYLETIGNADLVRGISDGFSLQRMIQEQEPSREIYEDLIAATRRMIDQYHWLARDEVGTLLPTLEGILTTSELIIDEFEKVEVLRRQAGLEIRKMETALDELFKEIRPEDWDSVDQYVSALSRLRHKRGEIITLREVRYIDLGQLKAAEKRVADRFDELSQSAVEYLLDEEALAPYHSRIQGLIEQAEAVTKVAEATPLIEALDEVSNELDVLTDIIGSLNIEDATIRTKILEEISNVFSELNRSKAIVSGKRKELLSHEGKAEFGAQFKLFSQSVTSAISLSDTAEKCDDQLSKLMVQLEDLESRFSEFDEFLEMLGTKREDVYEAFSSRKQALLDERQRRSDHTMKAAERILEGIERRSQGYDSADDLNAYFAADPMIMKVRDLADRIRTYGDSVRSDELESRLKTVRDEAIRSLRDRRDIYEEGESVIKLGRHRFSVNTQPLDLTLVPRDDAMAIYLTGTDFYQVVDDPAFEETRPYWKQLIVSETEDVYRGEYLAANMLADAEAGTNGLDLLTLREATASHEDLLGHVRTYIAERFNEGYERGLHDADGARILEKLVTLYTSSGLLRFAPRARALAILYWVYFEDTTVKASIERRAQSFGRLRETFAHSPAIQAFMDELSASIQGFLEIRELPHAPEDARLAGNYLFEELSKPTSQFTLSAEARDLAKALATHLKETGGLKAFAEDLRNLQGELTSRYVLALAWVQSFLARSSDPEIAGLAPAAEEAAALLLTEKSLNRVTSSAMVAIEVDELLGQHPRISSRKLTLRLDEFLSRLTTFRQVRTPGFSNYQQERNQLLERERETLRISEFKPKVMSAFVRNQLINDTYLPLIGDNLAKQMGALGDAKRTDLMGMLLLISPPGYGKTTLMEYIANRLGLVFMKINGPSLGHSVTSLDPENAPNAAARQEVEKVNLAFEMANNVLLYIDDIQHTSSEFLQKFISLCDAQRKAEGIWRGKSRTYDLRGKRFAICMAGNPYTESGEKFQIPDMLANRADIYNLGDVLSGKENAFALSYIENSLTSNSVLAQLAGHDLADVRKLVRICQGEEVSLDEISHSYSSMQLEEILNVMKKLLRVQEVLLAVNREYIRSASMSDDYRTEPAFKLQGSYRNMNKIAEKLAAVMNDQELEALIDDHYQGEAQTLTTGAEQNLLKLAELRGTMTDTQAERWAAIKRDFGRLKLLGGDDEDPVTRVTGQLSNVSERLEDIRQTISAVSEGAGTGKAAPLDHQSLSQALSPFIERLDENLDELAEIRSAPVASEATATDASLSRVAEEMSQKLRFLTDRLVDVEGALADASAAPAPAPTAPAGSGVATDLAPYLDRLDTTLGTLASAPRGGQIIQTLTPGVKELLDKMVGSIGKTLLPMVRDLEKRAELNENDHELKAQLNRTLKNFDLLKDMLETLRTIDTADLARRSSSKNTPKKKRSKKKD